MDFEIQESLSLYILDASVKEMLIYKSDYELINIQSSIDNKTLSWSTIIDNELDYAHINIWKPNKKMIHFNKNNYLSNILAKNGDKLITIYLDKQSKKRKSVIVDLKNKTNKPINNPLVFEYIETVSNDAKYLSCSLEDEIRIINLEQGSTLHIPNKNELGLSRVSMDGFANKIIYTDNDDCLYMYNINLKQEKLLSANKRVSNIAISNNGKYALFQDAVNSALYIVNTDSLKMKKITDYSGFHFSVSDNGKVVWKEGEFIKIFNIKTGIIKKIYYRAYLYLTDFGLNINADGTKVNFIETVTKENSLLSYEVKQLDISSLKI